ncbi:CobW family GTP-binding protein [Breoghania sp.]|uniref:GTP-binding protein n=1 Tax=Breoghania sp. TaxID=2065378 RepID=UPI0026047087|nr:CobW family GTP-binding protein [Breoghania sp.]MDJ0932875.1 CobW family GTP-binding protein [Breoghania sp.]
MSHGKAPGRLRPDPDITDAEGSPRIVDYAICYFPSTNDPLMDSFALHSAILAGSADMQARLRDFPAHDDLYAAFTITTLRVVVATDGADIGLALTGERRRRVLIEAGIPALDGGWLITPDSPDEDLPAFAMARDLFAPLAAGLRIATAVPPALTAGFEAPSNFLQLGLDDMLKAVPSPEASCDTDCLIWGAVSALSPALIPDDAVARSDDTDLDIYRRDPISTAPVRERPENPNDRPGLILLMGFLGSGKMTFLNQFIEYHTGHNELVTVIQNELGETGVDGMLLEGDDSVIAVDAGCVCCTLSGALEPTIRTLRERFRPDIIVLETTGLANPLNMVEELKELDDLIRLHAVVTIIDASRFRETLSTSDIAASQIEAADTLILNKCDLADEEALSEIHDDIARLNPRAQVIEASQGRVNPTLLETGFVRLLAEPEEAAPNEDHCCCGHGGGHACHSHSEHHHHDDDHCCGRCGVHHEEDHHHHHHSAHPDHPSHLGEGFGYLKLSLPEEVDGDMLTRLLVDCPKSVERIKGVVRLEGDPDLRILQFVPGHAEFVMPERAITEPPFLIVIGKGVDSPEQSAHWAQLTEKRPHATH